MSGLTNDKRDLIRRVYEEMWNRGDPAAAHALFKEPEGVEIFVGEFLQIFPDLQHQLENVLVEDDWVAARFSARGTHLGNWLEYPPTGVAVQYTGVTLARIAGGKIVEHQTWWDKWGLLQQMRG